MHHCGMHHQRITHCARSTSVFGEYDTVQHIGRDDNPTNESLQSSDDAQTVLGGEHLANTDIARKPFDETVVSKYNKFYGYHPNNLSSLKIRQKHCNLPKLMFVSHHKTGGYLKQWMPEFGKICFKRDLFQISPDESCEYNSSDLIDNHTHDYYGLVWFRNPFCYKLIVSKPIIDEYLILVMLRSPVEHILSGYNYHAYGHEADMWRLLKQNYFAQCMINVFDETDIIIKHNTSMYDEYAFSYSDWNNHTLLIYGLYLEFTRYYNCVWKQRIDRLYQSLKLNENKVNFIIIRFEWFHDGKNYKYRDSMRYLLMQMGIDPKNAFTTTKNILASLRKRSSVVRLYDQLLKWDWRHMNKWKRCKIHNTGNIIILYKFNSCYRIGKSVIR